MVETAAVEVTNEDLDEYNNVGVALPINSVVYDAAGNIVKINGDAVSTLNVYTLDATGKTAQFNAAVTSGDKIVVTKYAQSGVVIKNPENAYVVTSEKIAAGKALAAGISITASVIATESQNL